MQSNQWESRDQTEAEKWISDSLHRKLTHHPSHRQRTGLVSAADSFRADKGQTSIGFPQLDADFLEKWWNAFRPRFDRFVSDFVLFVSVVWCVHISFVLNEFIRRNIMVSKFKLVFVTSGSSFSTTFRVNAFSLKKIAKLKYLKSHRTAVQPGLNWTNSHSFSLLPSVLSEILQTVNDMYYGKQHEDSTVRYSSCVKRSCALPLSSNYLSS